MDKMKRSILIMIVLVGFINGCSRKIDLTEAYACLDEEQIDWVLRRATSFKVNTKDPNYSCESLRQGVDTIRRTYP